MEALFIGLLCYFDAGLESPFRYYYFLSLICCAIRHPRTSLTRPAFCIASATACCTWPAAGGQRPLSPFVLTLVMLGWVTWAGNAMALPAQARRRPPRPAQHGLAGEPGPARSAHRRAHARAAGGAGARCCTRRRWPRSACSPPASPTRSATRSRRSARWCSCSSAATDDPYTLDKLGLVSGQLQRIRATLRELIEFSRPASTRADPRHALEVLDEALNIAKYYKRTRGRIATPPLPPDLPPLFGVRDQLVQVFLNLVLNAIDATGRDGRVDLTVSGVPGRRRSGACATTASGIAPENAGRLFQPYFTTKKHGTGLGLFVTRQLVADHGGTVISSRVRRGGDLSRPPAAGCGRRWRATRGASRLPDSRSESPAMRRRKERCVMVEAATPPGRPGRLPSSSSMTRC